jgi:hypothetical protein
VALLPAVAAAALDRCRPSTIPSTATIGRMLPMAGTFAREPSINVRQTVFPKVLVRPSTHEKSAAEFPSSTPEIGRLKFDQVSC